jgi:ABC-2 type transport system permease protein
VTTSTGLARLRVTRLIKKEIRQLFRDPKSKRIIFIAPIIQLILFGYAVNTDVRHIPTALADRDGTALSRELVSTLTASGYFRIVERTDRSADLIDALDAGRAGIALEIPPGFARDVEAGRSARVQVLVDGTNSNTATVAQGYALRMIQDFRPGASIRGSAPGGVELRARAWFNPDLASRVYNVPAVIGVIMLLMCLLLTGLSVARERELGTLDQLLVSPVTPTQLMLGKTIPVAGVAMLQMTLVIAVALLWFGIPFRGAPLALLLVAFIYVLAGLSFGLFLSTFSKTQQEAFLTIFLFIFPAIILSGFLYPVTTMPWVFERLTLLNPLRHFLEVVRAIFLKGAGVRELWVQYATLAGMALLALYAGTRRFRKILG